MNVETPMGHNIGLSELYYRIIPTGSPAGLFEGRRHSNNQWHVERIKRDTKDNEYIIKGKIEEKNKQIEGLKEARTD